MVGRDVLERISKEEREPGPVVLKVEGVSAVNDKDLPALRNFSLDVRSGEIVGLAGVAGNGQSELAEVITGLRACHGAIEVNGRNVANLPAIDAIRSGVAHVPEDRHGVGSAPSLSITDNLIMKSYREKPVSRGFLIDTSAARQNAESVRDAYSISVPSIDSEARLLSGGNLQRLILAREIESGPASDGRRPAHARPGRWRDRERPPAVARAAQERHGHPADQRGPRRDPDPFRPGRRHLRGRTVRGGRRHDR